MKKSEPESQTRDLTPTIVLCLIVLNGLVAYAQNSSTTAPPVKSGSLIEQQTNNPQIEVAAVSANPPNPVIVEGSDDNVTLTAQVKAVLNDNPALSAFAFDVVTDRGVVWLFGSVDTMDTRAKAADLILKQPGVLSVRNNVHLTNGTIMMPAPPPAIVASNMAVPANGAK